MSHGKHVKILGKGDPGRLYNQEWIGRFLLEVVSVAGMRPLADPILYDVEVQIGKLGQEPFEDEGGVTGIVVLSTSHCAIHTWPLRREFVFDLYSCRDFNAEVVQDLIRLYFNGVDLWINDLSFSLARPNGSPGEPP